VGRRIRKGRSLSAWASFARGNEAIADPGQDVDPRLAWLYLIAAVIMLINGILSHKQYLREQEEQKAKQTPASQQEATTR
jgi:hypothetical protein